MPSNFRNMSRNEARVSTGDGKGAPVDVMVEKNPRVTLDISPERDNLSAKEFQRVTAFDRENKGKIERLFWWLHAAYVMILIFVSLGAGAVGFQYAIDHGATTDTLFDKFNVWSTAFGLAIGPAFLYLISSGFQAGAFTSSSRFVAMGLYLVVVLDEMGALYGKFNPDFLEYFMTHIAPFTLPVIATGAMFLWLLHTEKRRARKIAALAKEREHGQIMNGIKGDIKKTKDEERKRAMGTIIASSQRFKFMLASSVVAIVLGWPAAIRKAVEEHRAQEKQIEKTLRANRRTAKKP